MKLSDITGHHPSKFSYKPDLYWVAPNLKIGLEIEIENPNNIGMNSLEPFWKMEADGSLRDNGFEVVLKEPVFGADLTSAINQAEGALKKTNFVFNYRTGLHVHVDARELELDELHRLFFIYGIYEEAIFNFVGDKRNDNNFCAPWHRVYDHLPNIFTIFKSDISSQAAQGALSKVERYSALNCAALMKFGSLEYRHLQMSKDFEKIRKWVNLIMSIHNAAKRGSQWGPEVPTDVFIRELSKGGALGAAKAIFPPWFLDFVDDKSVWNGIMFAQELLFYYTARDTRFFGSSPTVVCPVKGQNPGYAKFLTFLEGIKKEVTPKAPVTKDKNDIFAAYNRYVHNEAQQVRVDDGYNRVFFQAVPEVNADPDAAVEIQNVRIPR